MSQERKPCILNEEICIKHQLSFFYRCAITLFSHVSYLMWHSNYKDVYNGIHNNNKHFAFQFFAHDLIKVECSADYQGRDKHPHLFTRRRVLSCSLGYGFRLETQKYAFLWWIMSEFYYHKYDKHIISYCIQIIWI